jgi:aspartyl-tRNA(Asn)/glutamyl-tRNA(Gln) amidotransferase subunit A
MKASFSAAIEGIDALLTPTAVTPAVQVACAATVPNGFTRAGLPMSLQIVCRCCTER